MRLLRDVLSKLFPVNSTFVIGEEKYLYDNKKIIDTNKVLELWREWI